LKCLKYYTFLDNQAAILRKVAMLGMCTALTVGAAAPPLYPGGGRRNGKFNCGALIKFQKLQKKFIKLAKKCECGTTVPPSG